MAKDISRTLIIGLGGTGQAVIREVKKGLLRRYGEIPELVKFLSFDTDKDDYKNTPFQYYFGGENRSTKKYNLQQDEFDQIGRPGLAVLKSDPICKNLNFGQLENIYGLTNGVGANGYRIMGRAHFLYNSDRIMGKLANTVEELKNADQLQRAVANKGFNVVGDSVSVYVVASLAGGTGSSAFMDLSRMLQHAGINMINNNADEMSDRIYGVFFLPSFFRNKPNTPNIRINTYVALSELDHALNLTGLDEGTPERENDLNVYNFNGAETTTNHPVRFSNVFLIDDTTRSGNKHDFEEATGYVASFLAASIAANASALESCYSNSTHSLRDLDGKKQFYSSLGYCEIRFDRQNLVKYLLNRQLNESLLRFRDGDLFLNMDEIADQFINENQLNEGIKSQNEEDDDTRSQQNQLIDSIYKIVDKRFVNKVMSTPATGKTASATIVKNKNNYITEINAEITEALREFAPRKRTLANNIRELLDEYQAKEGFGRFPDLAKRLCLSFTLMKEGLEDEIVVHNNKENEILQLLKADELFIKNNYGSGLLGIGSKKDAQKRRITSYKNKVQGLGTEENPTLCRLTLERARKEEAIRVYEELINIIITYYKEEPQEKKGRMTIETSGSFLDVVTSFDCLKTLIVAENEAYKPSKAAKNETIYVDAYFKEYFEKNNGKAFEFTESLCEGLYDQFVQILSNGDNLDNTTIENLRRYLLTSLPDTALIKKVQNYQMSLDQLFIDCFGTAENIDDQRDFEKYPHLAIFRQLDALFDPIWQYSEFRGGNSLKPALQCVVGVYDREFHILDRKNGYKAYLPHAHTYEFANVGDPDRIIFVLQEGAIPAFKVRDATNWKGEFDKNKGQTYAFSDERLERIEMITPEVLNENGEIAWAYGWLFGLIKSVAGRIRVKPTSTYMSAGTRVWDNYGYYNYFGITIQNSSDIEKCHRQFIRDNELFQDIYHQAMSLLDGDKPGNIVKIEHWVNDEEMWSPDIRGKIKTSMEGPERRVIQEEAKYLEKRFDRLSSTTLKITIDPSTRKVRYDDSLGILEQREKEYEERKKKLQDEATKDDVSDKKA